MRLAARLGIILTIAMLGGCVDHDTASIVIYGNASPTAPCGSRQLSTSTTTLTAGTLNVDYAGVGYQMFPIVENRLVTRATDLNANPNDIRLTEAEVALLSSSGDLIPTSGPNPFVTIADGFAETGGVAVPQIQAIPPSYFADLKAYVGDGTDTILVRITILGETLGGVDIISPEWSFPVEIVTGGIGFQCVGDSGAEFVGSEACYVGQDYGTDACYIAGLRDTLCGGDAFCSPSDM